MLTVSLRKTNRKNFFSSLLRRHTKTNSNILRGMCLSVFMLCITTPVLAENSGFYAGLGINNTTASEQGVNSTKNTVRFAGGYQFNKYFASELSLFSTGDHSKLGMKGNGASLGLLGQFPVYKRLNIFSEIGGVMIDQEINEANTTVDATGKNSLQDGKDRSLFIAFGLNYHFNDWTVAFKTAEIDTDADLSIMSFNLYRHF